MHFHKCISQEILRTFISFDKLSMFIKIQQFQRECAPNDVLNE